MIESNHRYQQDEGATAIDTHRAKDAGMALTLIALLLAYFWDSQRFLALAIVLMIVNMIVPGVFKPFAKLWFGLSHILGAIMSRLLLSLIFFLLVTPVGLIRRLMGKDSLKLRSWKNGSESVFVIRDVTFSKDNIEKPY